MNEGQLVASPLAKNTSYLDAAPQLARPCWFRATLIFAIFFAAYACTATQWIQGGDSAEFVTLGTLGGVAHPPGYPLYVLWLRLWNAIGPFAPAHVAALATGFWAALAAGVLFLACGAYGASNAAAALAVSLFALSPNTWRLATEAEVFALNNALAATLLWVCAPRFPWRGSFRAGVIGMLVGLGVSNHHTIVLLFPIIGLGLVGSLPESVRRWHRPLLCAFIGFCAGLTPYLYTWTSASLTEPVMWGVAPTIDGLVRHFLRVDYGTIRFAPTGDAHPLAQIAFFFRDILDDGFVILPALGVVGLARMLRSREPGVWVVFVSFLLSGPVFVLLLNSSPDDAISRETVQRFHCLPSLFLAFFAAFGWMAVCQVRWLSRRMIALIGVATLIAVVCRSGPLVVARHGPVIENYCKSSLESLPEHAILVGTGDQRLFGFIYAQRALGIRPDVLYIHRTLIASLWYSHGVDNVLRQPLPIRPLEMIQALLDTGRPVFLANIENKAVANNFATFPLGTAVRVLPPGHRAPALAEVEDLNLDLWARMKPDLLPFRPADSWAAEAQEDYARPWLALADAYGSSGEHAAQSRNLARVLQIAPWLVEDRAAGRQ